MGTIADPLAAAGASGAQRRLFGALQGAGMAHDPLLMQIAPLLMASGAPGPPPAPASTAGAPAAAAAAPVPSPAGPGAMARGGFDVRDAPAGAPPSLAATLAQPGAAPMIPAGPTGDAPGVAALKGRLAAMDKAPTWKQRLLRTALMMAPTAIGALAGGESGAAGAAKGSDAALQQERGLQEQRREQLLAQISQGRALQQQQYRTGVEAADAQARLRQNAYFRQAMMGLQQQRLGAQLARGGFTQDAQGNIVPDPNSPVTRLATARVGLAQAQQQLDAMKASLTPEQYELQRSRLDLQGKQVQAEIDRLPVDQQWAAASVIRAELSEINTSADIFGTSPAGDRLVGPMRAGAAIPGAAYTPEGKPLGLLSKASPTTQDRERAGWAQANLPTGERLLDAINAADKAHLLGPVQGRWSEFKAGKIGLGNVTYTQLRTFARIFNTGFMRAHMNSRSVEAVKHFEEMLDTGKFTAQEMRAALTPMMETLRQYERLGRIGLPNPFPRGNSDAAKTTLKAPAGAAPGAVLMEGGGRRVWVAPGDVSRALKAGAVKVGQ